MDDSKAVQLGYQNLTMVEFKGDDFDKAEKVAKRLGFTQTAYTSSSALWGLFCLPDRPTQKRGCVVKTRELGFMYVQCLDDMLMDDLEDT
jgi:hypothetical protein